jgi:hypothetical protein
MLTEQDYRQALVTRHPFWQALSPTAVKQRIDQLLAAPDPETLVQSLSPVEYTILLKEAPEMRPQLLQLAQPEQIRTVLDLDCWDKDNLQGTRVLEWFEALQQSGVEVFSGTLRALDAELIVAFLRQYLRIQGALPSEEEEEPVSYDEALTNELYRAEFLDPDSPLNPRMQQLLTFLRLADLDFYHHVMQAAMWEQDQELIDWAYRWRIGRLQDEGFPEYYDTLESYKMVDLTQLAPDPLALRETPGIPESAEAADLIPAYAWSLTPSGSLLDQALSAAFSGETLERLCWEMIALCNRELVYDQVDFADAIAVRHSLGRVHAYLNIGLEYLSGGDRQQLAHLFEQHALHLICQVGFTLVMRLCQRANRLHRSLTHHTGIHRALSSLAYYVLDGLLSPRPRFFVGLDQPGDTDYREFYALGDVSQTDVVLRQIETDPAYQPASYRNVA